ncbi:MAG: hypothetical protein J6X03_04420 [Bacilli bacterium]|nr:hypothetical protein [Bacilli bacterium]
MKFKNIFLMGTLICLINGLVSCNDNDATKSFEVKIASPSKAPAIALYSHLTEENVEINSAANNVVGYLTNNSDKDMVIVPTNAGINAIVKQNANFKIAATVTFGNFFLISTG